MDRVVTKRCVLDEPCMVWQKQELLCRSCLFDREKASEQTWRFRIRFEETKFTSCGRNAVNRKEG